MSIYDHIDVDSEGNWRSVVPSGAATMYFETVTKDGKPSKSIEAVSLREAREEARKLGLKIKTNQ